jgi:mRNA-degrading endonuclease YafQ of YafQ-DinJ toxin-antitoxin module
LKVIKTPGWAVERSDLFGESLAKMTITFPDLREKLDKFLEIKREDPIRARYGKHDRRMTGDLAGFWHCHLRDDAVLIYQLSGKTMTLIYIAPHAEIEGKRLKQTAKRLHGIAA